MFAAAALLLLALGPPVVLFDGELTVPRLRARGISVKVERPTYVHAEYRTRDKSAEARAALLTAAGVSAYQQGEDYDLLAVTPYAPSGEFRFLVMRPGEYVVLIDNRIDKQPSMLVHASVTSVEDPSLPRTLPAARRHAITALSLGLFGAIAGWSGWMLLRRQRNPSLG